MGKMEARIYVFYPIAHRQLGAQEQACGRYDQAVQWTDQHDPKDEELRRFRAEAAALLGLPEPPPADGEKKPEKDSPAKDGSEPR